jgi:pimeloyl-ACP methyl ester carboxylesterase
MTARQSSAITPVSLAVGKIQLEADLGIPVGARGIVLFAHGSGSSRYSPRNRYVASVLREAGLATLLADLLTESEEAIDERAAQLRFDIGLLTGRVIAAVDWLGQQADTRDLPVGLFGASTGAAAALAAAAERPDRVGAVVSRGGRPDLAPEALPRVAAPTLLIVGNLDAPIVRLNEQAYAELRCERDLKLVPRAGHLFEEPGALEAVAGLARDWFLRHLRWPVPARQSMAGRE